jgi:transcriptional regulator
MYVPPHFKEEDKTEIEKLVREFSFATLVSVKDNLACATHIPLELVKDENGHWLLHGHIARANEQWKNFETNADVLAIFLGPHSYISPSWYNHKNVPTWNYRAVHAYGKVRMVAGDELENMLRKLMARYENAHAENPQQYEEIPAKTLAIDLRGVVGFEIKVARVEATRKLSQNRDEESHRNIIEQLKKSDAYDAKRIAEDMERTPAQSNSEKN